MHQVISWLQTISWRKIVSVLFITITFLVIPAFSYSQALQAHADNSYIVDPATVKRIQEKAEDLGDAPGRRIGDTGLDNIKELGENIPETAELRARQGLVTGDPDDLNKKNVLDEIKDRVDAAKQAIQDAAS